ncbi:MAG: restriction endonuclease subunit S [Prevotella sp.]|nr:restriction endonuclease subunit S [Prevotella sp.]
MERYERYKDSGVYYLPQLPSHWGIRRAKFLFREEKRPTRKNDEIITCFRDGQVTLRKNRRTEGFTNSLKEIGYKGIRKGDLVIHNMDAFAGSIGVSDSDGKGTPVYSICTPLSNEISPYYYCYFLRYLAKCDFIKSLSKGIRERSTDFRFNDFKELSLPLPSIKEQKAIVNYIDSVTSKIDEAISQQQKMIDLLNERKQIIIQNAVTKGLDPNAKMKDSGVEWIGEIPEDWELKRFRFIFSENKNKNSKLLEKNQLQFKYGEIVSKDRQDISDDIKKILSNYSVVQEGDIMINGLNLNYDFVSQRVAIVREKGVITSAYISLRAKNGINSKFYNYFMKAMDSRKMFHGMGSGIRLTLAYDNIKNLFFPYPKFAEQTAIANFLDSETSKIDTSISQCNKMISLLQERKQIIINDVVTGKVKVV